MSADAERLPFEDGSFDLVLGHAVLHHIPDLPTAFGEFARVLAPGGTLLFAGEPSRYGDRLAGVPKRFAGAVAPLWRAALRARPRRVGGERIRGGARRGPGERRRRARLRPRRTARARTRGRPRAGTGERRGAHWPTGSAGPTAPWRPPPSPPTSRGRGASTPTAATSCCRSSTAACWSRGCPPRSSTT